jgi:hypothetical protein
MGRTPKKTKKIKFDGDYVEWWATVDKY